MTPLRLLAIAAAVAQAQRAVRPALVKTDCLVAAAATVLLLRGRAFDARSAVGMAGWRILRDAGAKGTVGVRFHAWTIATLPDGRSFVVDPTTTFLRNHRPDAAWSEALAVDREDLAPPDRLPSTSDLGSACYIETDMPQLSADPAAVAAVVRTARRMLAR